MSWYYVEQGKQTGPVSDDQFNALLQSETITPDTLVWREGMAEWVPYRQLQDTTTAAASAAGMDHTKPQAVCAECGKLFSADETIRYGDVRVCASCKPAFLQKLQEGAPINTGALNYAAFGPRFLAYFIDGILLAAVNWGIQFAVIGIGVAMAGRSPGERPMVPLSLSLLAMGLSLGVGISYETFLVGKYGATFGKMALKLKVVTADGQRISYARAFGRYFAKMLSGLTCLIGFIIAAFDNPQRRALHDYICNTRVIAKQR